MSKTVVAKFKCLEVAKNEHVKNVNLAAVYDGSDVNKDFTDATPNGNLNIQIRNNAPAADFFEPGKSYLLEFSEAAE